MKFQSDGENEITISIWPLSSILNTSTVNAALKFSMATLRLIYSQMSSLKSGSRNCIRGKILKVYTFPDLRRKEYPELKFRS